MSKKEMLPFNDWSQKRIFQGRKICTSRTTRYPDDPQVYYISPRLPWWFIKRFLWAAEGTDSPEELQKVIGAIHKHPIRDDKLFYVHFGNFNIQILKGNSDGKKSIN